MTPRESEIPVSDQTQGWFNEAGPRGGAPSFPFNNIGDYVQGTVADTYIIDYVPFGKAEPARDERTNEIIKQLVVVLDTPLRNWQGVSKVPVVDPNVPGSPMKNPADDDGKRAIYLRKWTNMYDAVGVACKAAGMTDGTLPKGAKLGIVFETTEDTGKGNPLKKYRAKVEPPAAGAGFLDAGQAPQQQYAQPAQQQAPQQQYQAPPQQQFQQQAPPSQQGYQQPPFDQGQQQQAPAQQPMQAPPQQGNPFPEAPAQGQAQSPGAPPF